MQQRLNPAQDKLYNAILQHENITDKLEQLEVWNEVYFNDVEYYNVTDHTHLGTKLYYNKYHKAGIDKQVEAAIDYKYLGEMYAKEFKDLINSHGLVYRRDE